MKSLHLRRVSEEDIRIELQTHTKRGPYGFLYYGHLREESGAMAIKDYRLGGDDETRLHTLTVGGGDMEVAGTPF